MKLKICPHLDFHRPLSQRTRSYRLWRRSIWLAVWWSCFGERKRCYWEQTSVFASHSFMQTVCQSCNCCVLWARQVWRDQGPFRSERSFSKCVFSAKKTPHFKMIFMTHEMLSRPWERNSFGLTSSKNNLLISALSYQRNSHEKQKQPSWMNKALALARNYTNILFWRRKYINESSKTYKRKSTRHWLYNKVGGPSKQSFVNYISIIIKAD